MNKKRKKKQQGKNIMFASATQGGHKTFKNVSCGYVIKAVDEQGSLCGWVYSRVLAGADRYIDRSLLLRRLPCRSIRPLTAAGLTYTRSNKHEACVTVDLSTGPSS